MSEQMLKGPVCVTGAAGYVGSWLVMRLLERGYTVRATVRDPGMGSKTKHLLELPEAEKRLTLWKADLDDQGSFDAPIHGCHGVFHVATPTDFDCDDPEEEVIKPCVNGMLNVLGACARAKSVKRVVFTSSAGTVAFAEHQKPLQVFDETNWTDAQFCRRLKMTGWMYFVSKTLAEKAAWEFAEEKGMDVVTIIPTLVVGPFIAHTHTMPPSLVTALSPVTRNESHYPIIKNAHLVHLDDLCSAHIFLYEHPQAKGRYICSSHSTTIIEVAKMLATKYPEYNVQTQCGRETRQRTCVRKNSLHVSNLEDIYISDHFLSVDIAHLGEPRIFVYCGFSFMCFKCCLYFLRLQIYLFGHY